MKKIITIACFMITAAPAVAADLRMPVKAPPPVAVGAYNWSGCYIGVQGGFVRSRTDNSFSFTGAAPFIAEDNTDGRGGVAGGHLGCNFQSGQWVFGVEGDGEWTNLKGDDAGVGGDINQLRARWMASVRGRVGLAFSSALLYVTGGAAFMGAESRVLDVGEEESIKKTITGWTVGGGLEYGFAPNFSGRIEYRYADFGTKDFGFPVNGYTERHNDIGIHALRVGLSYRFGGSPVVARY